MNKKYELVKDDYIVYYDNKLFRIRALKDFQTVNGRTVKVGDLGGYVQSEMNLNQGGNCWVADDAKVFDKARVLDNAYVGDNAKVYDSGMVFGNACIYDSTNVFGHAVVLNNACMYHSAGISDNAKLSDNACISDRACVYDNTWVCGNAKVCGYAKVFGNACVHDYAIVGGTACVHGHSNVYGYALVSDDANVSHTAKIFGHAYICGNACVGEGACVGGEACIFDDRDYVYVKGLGNCQITVYKCKDDRLGVHYNGDTTTLDKFISLLENKNTFQAFSKQLLPFVEAVKIHFSFDKNNLNKTHLRQ